MLNMKRHDPGKNYKIHIPDGIVSYLDLDTNKEEPIEISNFKGQAELSKQNRFTIRKESEFKEQALFKIQKLFRERNIKIWQRNPNKYLETWFWKNSH